MHLIKVGFLSMLFGTSVVLTPAPLTLRPGTVTLRSPRALTPASDAMQVVVSLGIPTEDERTRVTYGRFGPADVGNLRVRLCQADGRCLAMRYSGAYLAADFGLAYDLTGPALRTARFTAVMLTTAAAIPHVTVTLQNYRKLATGH